MVVWKGRGIHHLLVTLRSTKSEPRVLTVVLHYGKYMHKVEISTCRNRACCRLRLYGSCASRPYLAYRTLVLNFIYIYFYIQYFNACDLCVGFI
jgi:hypothetical protein